MCLCGASMRESCAKAPSNAPVRLCAVALALCVYLCMCLCVQLFCLCYLLESSMCRVSAFSLSLSNSNSTVHLGHTTTVPTFVVTTILNNYCCCCCCYSQYLRITFLPLVVYIFLCIFRLKSSFLFTLYPIGMEVFLIHIQADNADIKNVQRHATCLCCFY